LNFPDDSKSPGEQTPTSKSRAKIHQPPQSIGLTAESYDLKEKKILSLAIHLYPAYLNVHGEHSA
jgi:hypothetical protein